MAETRKFTVKVEKAQEGRYTDRCLEIPGAINEGETMEELKTNMTEAISLVLKSIEKDTKSDEKLMTEIPN